MIRFFLLSAVICISLEGVGQSRYWIQFADKPSASREVSPPGLSRKALERRMRLGISADETDLPISDAYLNALAETGARLLQKSKWLNAVSVVASPRTLTQIAGLPFVKKVIPVRVGNVTQAEDCDPTEDLGTFRIQLSMLGLDDLHANGFTGKGIRIAILDNGFQGVDSLSALQHIHETAPVFTRDFVEGGNDVYGPCDGSCRHGTSVLGILAARIPGELLGTAPDAEYILIRTENDRSETHQEEDNWLAGAELADSLGADIIVSSLTYKTFDPGEGNYAAGDMDGETALVTLAAEAAAAKGILVVNSAGNRGSQGIEAPADGKSVLAVGSVNETGSYSNFSSIGPTADGRVKPDLTAMGELTYYLRSDGSVRQGVGTSWSCPLVGGLAACLMQATGNTLPPSAIYDALITTASQAGRPDNRLGYGIPDGREAYRALTGENLREKPCQSILNRESLIIYPQPAAAGQEVWAGIENESSSYLGIVQVIDMTGRTVFNQTQSILTGYNTFPIPGHLLPGIYLFRAIHPDGEGIQKKFIMP